MDESKCRSKTHVCPSRYSSLADSVNHPSKISHCAEKGLSSPVKPGCHVKSAACGGPRRITQVRMRGGGPIGCQGD